MSKSSYANIAGPQLIRYSRQEAFKYFLLKSGTSHGWPISSVLLILTWDGMVTVPTFRACEEVGGWDTVIDHHRSKTDVHAEWKYRLEKEFGHTQETASTKKFHVHLSVWSGGTEGVACSDTQSNIYKGWSLQQDLTAPIFLHFFFLKMQEVSRLQVHEGTRVSTIVIL